MTVTRRIRSPGRARNKPLKPLRAGMPGDLGVPVVTMLVCFVSHLHARLRVHWAPGIPHALCFQGASFMHTSGASRRGNADLCFDVIASEAKQSRSRHSGAIG